VFHIARNPDVWNKLRAEVLAIQGHVTRDVLRSMPYMQAVLNESRATHQALHCQYGYKNILLYEDID
jgi:cytochrome P450